MPKCKNCNNLYNLSDKNDVIVGKWCPKINDSPHLDMERNCEHYKAMTNADRIRSMTDEELAEMLDEVSVHGILALGSDFPCDVCRERTECKNCFEDWLRAESEG